MFGGTAVSWRSKKQTSIQHYQLLSQNTQLYVVLQKKPVG